MQKLNRNFSSFWIETTNTQFLVGRQVAKGGHLGPGRRLDWDVQCSVGSAWH